MLRSARLALSMAMAVCIASSVFAQQSGIEHLATHRVSGTALDRSNLTGSLETGGPINALGGWSAIEYDPLRQEFLLLSDRGPGDGAASFPCRFHRVFLSLHQRDASSEYKTAYTIDFQLRSTHLFQAKGGKSYTGSLASLQAWSRESDCPSLDPEGLRVVGDTIYVSDEYGPSIRAFRLDGGFGTQLPLPDHTRLAELRKARIAQGTFANRGIEGLCVTPDGSKLVGAFQGPLVQDGRVENNKCLGINTRWIVLDSKSSSVQEFVYQLEDESTGVSEILAVDADRFLVLERDSLAGDAARIKRIYLASWENATDVHSHAQLPVETPDAFRPVTKKLLIDLQSPELGMSGAATPEKPEGLALGPDLPDGRKVLWVCFDNDFDATVDSIVMAFAISRSVW